MTSPQIDNSSSSLSVIPLGAGDLIDRAVRFYRQNFRTLLLIAAPPVVAGALVSVVWRLLGREVFGINTSTYDERIFYYLFVWLGTTVIWFFETVATLAVMGGASRNFVRHLLFGEPLTFGETYRNVRSRLGALIVASSILTILLGVIGIIDFYLGIIVATLAVFLVVAAFSWLPALAAILSVVVAGAVVFGAGALFFLIASRFAYVPQVMMVEGLGVGSAISRSSSLASGNVKRLAALFIFTTVATYSALALLYVPLAWYGWLSGVEILYGNADSIPAWYEIASQLIGQASLIILLPVWMVGLCLLYVDERVRQEGYDIELMAARSLGEIPAVPSSYINPLQPALSTASSGTAANGNSSLTTLGLR
jgi:hypothetical protein